MATDTTPNKYQVLARKYRPGTFADLIGQEALVQTLSNAINSGRIAHAFILTGIRGIGKTTTARIIAKALNCIGKDGNGGPTTDPCGECSNCQAIVADRHPDIIEMDAASRTGVDDIREIIENANYLPTQARYKIYIIDEVHMLSKNAFNALLKTLEEPPAHVKFIFATTEIRKIPVTILSRCQRFDLRRVTQAELCQHLTNVAKKEQAELEEDAVALIANAAEGSVRDGLSLLDQAISHSDGKVTASMVENMLGLAGKEKIITIFAHIAAGEAAEALALLQGLYTNGADIVLTLQDLLAFTHFLTKLKVTPELAEDHSIPEVMRTQGKTLAEKLPLSYLGRCWQMLLKGLEEVKLTHNAFSAAEMVLIRLCYAANLPTPDAVLKTFSGNNDNTVPAANTVTSTPSAANVTATPDQAPTLSSPGNSNQTATHSNTTATAQPTSTSTPITAGATALDAHIETTSELATETQAQTAQEMVESRPDTTEKTAAPVLNSFEEVVALFKEKKEALLYNQLLQDVHLVSFASGRIEIRPKKGLPGNFAGKISTLLSDWTGTRWVVTVSQEEGMPTIAEHQQAKQEAEKVEVSNHPTVQKALELFPGAEITSITESQNKTPETE